MENCVFCNIAGGEAPALIVHETEEVICFLPENLEVYGHTLIIPKRHFADFYDIPEQELSNLIAVTKNLILTYRRSINATGANLLHASGVDGQQSVFHFHFHLLPRFEDDGINTWPGLARIDVDREDLLEKIRLGQ